MTRSCSELAAFRGCPYQTALNELRGLPPGTSWTEYVAKVITGELP